MKFRLLGFLFLTISCGKQVNIDHTALEEASKLSTKDYKTGVVTKLSDKAYLQFNNKSYQLSDFSSANAQDFFKSVSGSVNVRFSGEVKYGANCKRNQESFQGECILITEILSN